MLGALLGFVLLAPPTPSTGPSSVRCAAVAAQDAQVGALAVATVDGESGEMIHGAMVFVSDGPAARELSSNDEGLAWAQNLPPGEYLVLASDERGNDQVAVTIQGGERCVVTFLLRPDAVISEMSAADEAELEGDVYGPSPEPSVDEIPKETRRRNRDGETLRGAGIGVITIGAVMMAGAGITAMLSPCGDASRGDSKCIEDTGTQLAIGFGVVGAASVIGGGVMVVKGAKRIRLSGSLGPARRGRGAMARVGLRF